MAQRRMSKRLCQRREEHEGKRPEGKNPEGKTPEKEPNENPQDSLWESRYPALNDADWDRLQQQCPEPGEPLLRQPRRPSPSLPGVVAFLQLSD